MSSAVTGLSSSPRPSFRGISEATFLGEAWASAVEVLHGRVVVCIGRARHCAVQRAGRRRGVRPGNGDGEGAGRLTALESASSSMQGQRHRQSPSSVMRVPDIEPRCSLLYDEKRDRHTLDTGGLEVQVSGYAIMRLRDKITDKR